MPKMGWFVVVTVTQGQGHSRSPEITPIDRADTCSY